MANLSFVNNQRFGACRLCGGSLGANTIHLLKMWNPFKRKTKVTGEDLAVLKKIVAILPAKYSYLKDQISEEFIIGKKPNELGDENTLRFSLDSNLAKKFGNPDLPEFFIIKNIKIWNAAKHKYSTVELHILTGFLAGIRINAKYKELNFNKFDVSDVSEKHFQDDGKTTLNNLLSDLDPELTNYLDLEETFLIEIPEGEFYTIKNLGDGNYLAINDNREVYSLIHDPYEVEKIFESIDDFYASVKTGIFNIDKYLNKKIG